MADAHYPPCADVALHEQPSPWLRSQVTRYGAFEPAMDMCEVRQRLALARVMCGRDSMPGLLDIAELIAHACLDADSTSQNLVLGTFRVTWRALHPEGDR